MACPVAMDDFVCLPSVVINLAHLIMDTIKVYFNNIQSAIFLFYCYYYVRPYLDIMQIKLVKVSFKIPLNFLAQFMNFCFITIFYY